ncbi:GPR154 [Mytilus edulis]|uniref:NPSR1 n=1 Tax=Mytilus edulis TaxID=6550 RepID=A0A8S3TMF1_MYTED|nr:GPR154 [Mytilus edulis]
MDYSNRTAKPDWDVPDRNDKDADGSVWTPEIITRVSTVFTVMIFTLIGNILLITLILYKKSRRRKRVNIFIINLAIGDLAIAAITMTTEILFVAFGEWVLGPFMCKMSVYLQVVTLASSTFLLTGMSIDRYQVIVRPMQSLARRPKIWRKVVIAWLMAFCFALPQLAIFVHVEQQVTNTTIVKRMCLSKGYSAPWQRKFYFGFLTLYTLFVPAIIMSYCYYKIAQVVWSRVGSHKNGISSTHSEGLSIQRSLVSRPKQRVVTMTLTVIIGFLSTLTPYFTISLIRIYSDYTIQLKKALDISEIILMMHSAINPVLYGIFTFRLHHLKSLCKPSSDRNRLRPNSTKSCKTEVRGCLKLKCQIKFVKRRSRYYDTSTIIANHVIKEERENFARSVRNSCNNRCNYEGLMATRINKSEKSVQVSESILFRNSVFIDDLNDNCSNL